MRSITSLASLTLGTVLASQALVPIAGAAPARLITKPPVVGPPTGPSVDPTASKGQWFLNPATGLQEFRTHEFYDNVPAQGGGPLGHLAIEGNITSIAGGVNAPITGFIITATVTNDLPGLGAGQPGSNSHGEFLAESAPYQGTMLDVKLTGEFAFPGRVTVPGSVLTQIVSDTPPYNAPFYSPTPPFEPAIIARNEDQEAWYSFAGEGGYHVPTWDFGDIAPGASATRRMEFEFSAPLDSTNPLWAQLQAWQVTKADLFMNRTTDLKVGNWVDLLAADSVVPYPVPADRSGNVSAFFNVPEPSSLTVLALGGLAMLRRTRRRAAGAATMAAAAAAVALPSIATASPARLITKPPVIGPPTGPAIDPAAAQGQWFRGPNGPEEFRTHEFYDNIQGAGGSAPGSRAIEGLIGPITTDPSGAVTGFSIFATIRNNLPGVGFAEPGRNSHQEELFGNQPFQGSMLDVKLTGEFALSVHAPVPPIIMNQIMSDAPPYMRPDYGGTPVLITAVNDDQQAWFSYTGEGGYHVPTWDFGDIPIGGSATRRLDFVLNSPQPPGSNFSAFLNQWASNQSDVLIGRSTDLKIGDWVDVLRDDPPFAPYPGAPMNAGNSSVFFNIPEPTAAVMMPLAVAGILASRRRRT